MRGICFCIGDMKELGELINSIQTVRSFCRMRSFEPVVILDPGMKKPSFLDDYVVHTDVGPEFVMSSDWLIDVLFVTHRSTIGRHLVEHWDRPQVKFLYQGLYAPKPEWLALHSHLHTVWGLTDVCVKGFETLDPWVVDAVKFGEQMGPGRRLVELMGA